MGTLMNPNTNLSKGQRILGKGIWAIARVIAGMMAALSVSKAYHNEATPLCGSVDYWNLEEWKKHVIANLIWGPRSV